MARRVKFIDLKNPGLLGVHYRFNPFSEGEIIELTEGVKKFALTDDGDFLQIWGE